MKKKKHNKKKNRDVNKEKNVVKKKKIVIDEKELLIKEKEKKRKIKKFGLFFLIWLFIFAVGLVKKTFQNDTFYTIKIGELILNNGIDMLDHFSFHADLAYTYPHWLYDVFIYIIYNAFGYTGIYISSIVLFFILLTIIFKINSKICSNISVAAFATFVSSLAIGSFITARAQLASFIVFALQIYFIESFLKTGKKKNLIGLLILSLILCNIHVAVWPFYFILYLPYLAEYIISFVCSKIKLKKENKFIKFLKNKFVLEKNNNIKYLFIVMLLSLLTGLLTPIGDTPYTYLIKTMMGNSQNYIQEHQMITWSSSPFTIIIAFETFLLAMLSKVKLRDIFMVCGLVLMSIFSVRHLSLLALIGTICYARIFSMFFDSFKFNVDNMVINFLSKKKVYVTVFVLVIGFSIIMLNYQNKKEFINSELYPVDAVKYIKENVNINDTKIYNEYDFGSYLILEDIPVFIDSRADLYTKQFSGFEYDIFDDYAYLNFDYQEKMDFYGITHALLRKEDSNFYNLLKNDKNYELIYEDDYFVFYEKTGNINSSIKLTYGKKN